MKPHLQPKIKNKDVLVERPVLRTLAAILLLLVITPIIILSIPLHFVLRLFGRRGFFHKTAPGKYAYDLEKPAFERN